MNKAEIERMVDLRTKIISTCLSIKSCRHCPLLIEGDKCAGIYLSRTMKNSPKKVKPKK